VAARTTRDFVRGVIAVDGRTISMIELDAVIPDRAEAQAA